MCDPLIPQGNQYRNLDQFFLNCHHVPTNFAKNRVSVPKKLNANIIRLDFGSSDSRKKREKVDFQSRLWTLNLKNFPNRGAKGRRRGSGNFQIETAQWGSRRKSGNPNAEHPSSILLPPTRARATSPIKHAPADSDPTTNQQKLSFLCPFMFIFIYFDTDRHFTLIQRSQDRVPLVLKGAHSPEPCVGKSTRKLF